MEFVYHVVTIRVNETSWAHVWRLRSRYLRTWYDSTQAAGDLKVPFHLTSPRDLDLAHGFKSELFIILVLARKPFSQ
jgi:hypothetical protein